MKARFLIIFIVLACFLPSCRQLFKKGFPQYSGEVKSAVKQPVEIYRDAYGVPHIYAQSEYDVYFAQGYVHAQDRLWQMETLRRLARGRLAEIAGKDALEFDMFMRLLGMDEAMKRIASEASEQTKGIARAYVDGINAYIRESGKKAPLEFSALKLLPEPYTEEDLFATVLLNSWFLNTNFLQELLAVRMMNRLNADAFADLFPSYPNAHLPADDYFNSFKSLKVAPFLKAVDVFSGTSQNDSGSTGSNCWVVSGDRSFSGKPMLANDPHLAQSVPGVWYLNHLVTPSMNVAGASMAGSPCVITGHNESISWGITNVMTDYVDLYVMKVDPSHPTRYFVDGKVLEMEREEITINVKDCRPEHRTIYHTIHGPVITRIEKGDVSEYDAQIALKWHGKTADGTLEAFYRINRAENVEDAIKAGRYFGMVCLNLAAADSLGNIGWHVTGKTPIRKGYSGRLPADGSRSGFGWEGFIPYDELPSTFNPPSGIIVTSNDRRMAEDYPYSISYSWAAPYRAQRIRSLLSSKPQLNKEDYEEIQSDHYSLQAEKLISQMADFSPKDEEALFALESLRNWDKRVTAESWQAAIYEMFLIFLTRNLLIDEIGEDLRYYCSGFAAYTIVDEILSRPDSPFWDRVDTAELETREQILEKSLSDAVVFLTEKFGKKSKKWKWGRLHQIYYNHPGATSWFTRRYMNAGSYPLGGDNNTVNIGGFSTAGEDYNVATIPSLRTIIDMGDISNGQIIIPMGQSGQPQHPHYKDMIQRWLKIEYVPMYFEKKDVAANHKKLLILNP